LFSAHQTGNRIAHKLLQAATSGPKKQRSELFLANKKVQNPFISVKVSL
jgi:hypothetical protein